MLLSLLSLLLWTAVASEADVVVLTDATFDAETAKMPFALIEFYAPWCGHCKSLAPEYAKAASLLAAEDPPVALAKVDCTVETALSDRFSISGYPTLKLFRFGQEVGPYEGPRTAAGIAQFMKAKNGPAAKSIASVDAFDAFVKADSPRFVAFVTADSDAASSFLAAAERLREHYTLGVSTSADVAKAAGVSVPALVAFLPSSFHTPRATFTGALTDDAAVRAFVTTKALPLAGIYDRDVKDLYANTGLPRVTVWTKVDETNAPKQMRYYLNRLRKVAAGYAGKAMFVLQDTTRPSEYNDLGFPADAEFGLGAVGPKGEKYKSDLTKFSVEALEAFAADVVAGKLEQHIKSEPIPASQDEAVTVVVAKQWDELVNDPERDVLIEFYAPWCGHCKTLAPKYEELAKKMQKYGKTLRIAKIDATANDIPPEYQVQGFPTLILQKNDGSEPVPFDGVREVPNMVKFLKENVARKLVADTEKSEL